MLFDILLDVTGFNGSFEMLVEQVRRHELDVIHVKLAEVAERLVEAVRPNIDLQQFTPFLSLSKLLFVKSRNLLPGRDQFGETGLDEEAAQEEEEPTEVRERLLEQYKAFQSVRDHFRELETLNASRLRSMQTRTGEMPGFIDEIVFLEKVTPFDLLAAMAQIERRSREDRSYHVRANEGQRLSDRIAEVFSFILERRGGPVSFNDIVSIAPQKQEAVISFLAVIYLVAQGKVAAHQKIPYGDIIITAGAAG
ncbi:MAG: segregation/condensation protein A [bacterium]